MRQVLTLKSGARSVLEIIDDGHDGEIVTHYLEFKGGKKSTMTCTCTCSGSGSVSKTCKTGSSPVCDCTGSAPVLTC